MSSFSRVTKIGLTFPDVEAATKYDGSPVLRVGGCFMAGIASHPSAEPGTLVVRAEPDGRELLLEDAPETYYLTDYYRKYPLVLVRLSRVDEGALRDLLNVSRRLTLDKARRPGGHRRPPIFLQAAENSGSQGAPGAPARSGAGRRGPRKRRAGVRGGAPI